MWLSVPIFHYVKQDLLVAFLLLCETGTLVWLVASKFHRVKHDTLLKFFAVVWNWNYWVSARIRVRVCAWMGRMRAFLNSCLFSRFSLLWIFPRVHVFLSWASFDSKTCKRLEKIWSIVNRFFLFVGDGFFFLCFVSWSDGAVRFDSKGGSIPRQTSRVPASWVSAGQAVVRWRPDPESQDRASGEDEYGGLRDGYSQKSVPYGGCASR